MLRNGFDLTGGQYCFTFTMTKIARFNFTGDPLTLLGTISILCKFALSHSFLCPESTRTAAGRPSFPFMPALIRCWLAIWGGYKYEKRAATNKCNINFQSLVVQKGFQGYLDSWALNNQALGPTVWGLAVLSPRTVFSKSGKKMNNIVIVICLKLDLNCCDW